MDSPKTSRRRLLATTGALALALPAAAHAAVGDSPAPAGPPGRPARAVLADLRVQLRGIERAADAGAPWGMGGPGDETVPYFRDVMATLCVTAAMGEIDPAERSAPEVQRLLDDAQPTLDRAIHRALEVLRAVGPGEAAEIQGALRGDPTLLSRAHDLFIEGGFSAHVPRPRLRRFTATWQEVGFQLREQDAHGFVLDALQRADRRLALAAARHDAEAAALMRPGEREKQTSRVLLGIGLGWLIGATASLAPGVVLGFWPGTVVAATIGVVLLIAALVALATSHKRRNDAEKADAERDGG